MSERAVLNAGGALALTALTLATGCDRPGSLAPDPVEAPPGLAVAASQRAGPEVKLTASDADADDHFGESVAIDGDVAVAGASGNSDLGPASGSAYVFRRSGRSWTEEEKLIPRDGSPGDNFGEAVAVDGDVVVVGAHSSDDGAALNTGSAYVYRYGGAGWRREAKLTAGDASANDNFGRAVAVDGDVVVVGAYPDDNFAGSAYVFRKTRVGWRQEGKLIASDRQAGDRFGISVSVDGDVILVGAEGDESFFGSAYVFRHAGGIWTQEDKLTASGGFAGQEFGHSVSVAGDVALVGAHLDDPMGSKSGSTHVFRRTAGAWIREAKLTASDGAANDRFGHSVSLVGETALIGAYRTDDVGSAYVFQRDGGAWSQQAELVASDGAARDLFGWAVSLTDDVALVGARGDDHTGSRSGSAYVFDLSSCLGSRAPGGRGPCNRPAPRGRP